ncbi:30S ribosomal protein THX [Chryseobacterium sp.]|nr:30S ribosomal protein THX [Chryseobacterium sp.]
MGKGDKKTKRGKINAGSYGKKRRKKTSKNFAATASK